MTFHSGNITGPSATINRGNSAFTGRNTALNPGRTALNDRRPSPWAGSYGWPNDRGVSGWVGYASASSSGSYYPYSSGYYPDSSGYSSGSGSYYPYSSSYSSDDSYPSAYSSYLPSGSQADRGTSGASSRAAAPSATTSDEGAENTDKETAEAERRMESARRAFQKGDYAEAQRECERALRQLPGDANLHEFRALCQFAQGKYQDAAATLYEVLGVKPGWDWKTLGSFYPSAATYTKQLRALEQSVKENPKDAAGHFVLAYHYLALEERDAVVGQLREVTKLQPRDQVSPAILNALE
jgi:tetratricopeptide (TPR) repeat protein